MDDFDFTLTEEEIKAYRSFSKNLNEQHLKGLNPLSVAKLYVQANLDQRFDVTYALYTDRQEHILWTKEENENLPDSDIENTQRIFKNIEKGEFIQTSDFEGYIKYYKDDSKSPEAMMGFSMIKNENGIWQVGFMPIQ
ncbi:RNA polymerase subunit sigma [Bacillus lacus]|uniref:RNA polymerase subunit sigma n=1 Tax=Metabacillus lacus TaxID=1983721 RepID=A0A7X2J1H2_9BACI|nr:RNA polymerase subunit sigma [Metabacillus lacus]